MRIWLRAEKLVSTVVFAPQVDSLYEKGYDTWVEVGEMSKILEGECRPGHFRGVTTIVTKLLNIVQPDVACFGQKDFQQQTIIRKMVQDLNLPVEIEICPTIREADGLAMSSRNSYLSHSERQSALALSQALERAETMLRRGKPIEQAEQAMLQYLETFEDVRPEYGVVRDPDTLDVLDRPQAQVVALIAAYVGKTRLIDNRKIDLSGDP